MSGFDRLRHLLLDGERRRLDALEDTQQKLPEALPGLIDAAQRAAPEALARSLATPVADALGGAVQARRQSIVDALFPVIMPAIRRAIAEYLRSISQDLNRVFESSLTWRGLKWRLEARRLGVSYAAVALRHSLLYQVDHLFLIQRDSGLILDRESADGLPDLDADAVAGMLTAIGDFVRDSVGEGQGELSSATVGEHLLWVLGGPHANLAALIRGVPPESLKRELADRLERVHAAFGDALAGSPEALGRLPGLRDALTPSDLKAVRPEAMPEPSVRPLLWSAAAVLVVVLAMLVAAWRWSVRTERLVAAIDATPGLEVLAADSWPWWSLDLHLLRDPLADDPAPLVRDHVPGHVRVGVRTQHFLSADSGIVVRRLAAALDLPESAVATLEGTTLRLSGKVAPEGWQRVRQSGPAAAPGFSLDTQDLVVDWPVALAKAGSWPAGVRVKRAGDRFRFTGSADAAWITAARRILAERGWSGIADLEPLTPDLEALRTAWNRDLAARIVRFDQGEAVQGEGLDALLQALAVHRADPAFSAGRWQLACAGSSDPSGTEDENRRLERERANWLCATLEGALGDGPEIAFRTADEAGDRATLRERAARVYWELLDRS